MKEQRFQIIGKIKVIDERRSKNEEYIEVKENPFHQQEQKSKKLINLIKNWDFVDRHLSLIDFEYNKKNFTQKLEKLIPDFDIFDEKMKRKRSVPFV
jgi:hypothetical protein